MTRATKKGAELALLTRFRDVCTRFPDGDVEPSEAPDFIVRGKERRVGIEVTELFVASGASTSPPQALESARASVLANAQDLMLQGGDPPLAVSVHFSQHWQPSGRDLASLAQRLVSIVRHESPIAPGTSVTLGDGDERLADVWDAVVAMTVHYPERAAQHFWMAPGFAWIAPIERAKLAEVVATKERLLPRYLTRVDRAWLLIAFRSSRLSSAMSFDPSVLQPPFASAFDRIYLYDDFRRDSWLLSPPQSDAA
ncbi:MAG: hypothetical protein IPN47_08225 [Gemmatimonadetes bacterium]|nr:hypothetical protein [Gemmatimonadota bacterium]